MSVKFGEALEALRVGKLVRRSIWEPGHFIFMQIPSQIKAEIVPKMQSVPDAAKKVFEKRFNDETEQIDAIYYANQFAYVGFSNLISGYSPSPEDCFAEDWESFE